MSSIINYEKADCQLFRTPPVDFSVVHAELERLIVEAWKNGNSADAAVQSILSNRQIMDPLKAQIEQNLEFQKKAELERIEHEKQRFLEIFKKNKDDKLNEIKDSTGKALSSAQDAYTNASSIAQQTADSYNAAQASLTEMKARIAASIEELGGIGNYQALLDIHTHIQAPSSEGTTLETKLPEPSPKKTADNIGTKIESLSQAGPKKPKYVTTVVSEDTPLPAPNKELKLEQIVGDYSSKHKQGIIRRTYSKIKNFFYKIYK